MSEENKALIPNQDPNFFNTIPNSGDLSVGDVKKYPYKYYSWIFACCRAICFNLATLPRYLYDVRKPDKKIIDHQILNVLQNPNQYMSYTSFWQSIILALLLPVSKKLDNKSVGGQAFIVGRKNGKNNKVNFGKGEIPITLLSYTEDAIERDVTNEDQFIGWKIRGTKAEGGEHFDPSEIIRITSFSPYDWLGGIPSFLPAQLSVLQDTNANIYNSAFFENDATIAGLLTAPGPLNAGQIEIYFKKWYERHGGAGNAQKLGVVGDGITYDQYGSNHADMQFIEQKKQNLEEILAVYGLNKIAIGMYEGINYATIKEGRRMLWQDTYLPIDNIILNAFNYQWIKQFDPNLRLASDYTNVEALKKDYTSQIKNASILVKDMKFPAALAAQINGVPLTEKNIKEYPWLNEKPGEKEKIEEKPEAIEPEKGTKSLDVKIKTAAKKRLYDQYKNNLLAPGEKEFVKILDRFFNSQRNRMQDNVDKWAAQLSKIQEIFKVLNIDINSFLLPVGVENTNLEKIITPVIEQQMKRDEKFLDHELDGLIAWHVADESAMKYVRQRREIIATINNTTFKTAHDKIGDAIETITRENLSQREAVKKIKEAISDVGEVRKNQARTIATTEIGSVSSASRYGAYHTEGIEYCEWLTAGDGLVRKTHKIAGDAGPIKLGQLYPEVNMRYPLDPMGPIGEIVNCRCVLISGYPI